MNTRDQLQDIFRDIFDNQSLQISNQTSAADIEEWDSLANIDLIVSIENKFGVKFNLQDIQGLKNVGDMVQLIEKSAAK